MTNLWLRVLARIFLLVMQFIVWPVLIVLGLILLGFVDHFSWSAWLGAFLLSQVFLGMIAVPKYREVIKEEYYD